MGFHDGQQKCAIFRLREAALFLFRCSKTPGRGTYNQPHVAMCDHKQKHVKRVEILLPSTDRVLKNRVVFWEILIFYIFLKLNKGKTQEKCTFYTILPPSLMVRFKFTWSHMATLFMSTSPTPSPRLKNTISIEDGKMVYHVRINYIVIYTLSF